MNPTTTRQFTIALGLSLLLIAVLWLVLPNPLVQALDSYSVYYVAPSCASVPAPCFTSIQAAVDAVDAPTDVIKAAAGTYTDVHGRARNDITTTGVVTQVVYVSKTLTIQGGYTTTNWTTSDPDTNHTTLDAQGQGRVVYVTGNISPTIEGLWLTGGNADKYVQCDACGMEFCCRDSCNGGGMYVFSATAIVNHNNIAHNRTGCPRGVDTMSDGGGIYLDHSNSTLCGNTVSSNWGGGGVFLKNGAPTLSQNTIISNTGTMGGGIALAESDATLSQNIVKGNRAADGGGLYLNCSTLTLNGNTIRENQASIHGGGLAIEGSKAILQGNALILNTADYGGGGLAATMCGGICFCLSGRTDTNILTLKDNSLRVNTARYGGGLYILKTDATLINNVVTGNRVEGDGAYGGGLLVYSSTVRSLHNTIARNRGSEGSGLYVESYQ
jgi:parallel beta-helix repeat protein